MQHLLIWLFSVKKTLLRNPMLHLLILLISIQKNAHGEIPPLVTVPLKVFSSARYMFIKPFAIRKQFCGSWMYTTPLRTIYLYMNLGSGCIKPHPLNYCIAHSCTRTRIIHTKPLTNMIHFKHLYNIHLFLDIIIMCINIYNNE